MSALFRMDQVPRVLCPLPRCGSCGLCQNCLSPKMDLTGEGRRKVLVVAEAPGAEEDRRGVQLVGDAGKLLRRELQSIGIDLDRDCWKTNAVICRPPRNRTPSKKEIDCCRSHLLHQIKTLKPVSILLLGLTAVRSLIGFLQQDDPTSLSPWTGWRIPCQRFNSWICPTWHPSYLNRVQGTFEGKAVFVWFRRHLKKAFELEDRPWKEVPDYRSRIELVYDPDEAADRIDEIRRRGNIVSFDYETNMLKPDSNKASVVTCAVCRAGLETIAFPWIGRAVSSMGMLLKSDCPKIGANVKFEERWTRKIFGHGVKRWIWDTVLSAHHLDNRRGITSVKFQAFVRLGVDPWNIGIESFLKSKGGSNSENRIRDIPMRELLLYNGMDALVEYKLASCQREEMLSCDC